METIDPRVTRWLAQKNALTARFLAALEAQVKRIAAAHDRRTLAAEFDVAMDSVIPALKFHEAAYGLTADQYNAANALSSHLHKRLDPPSRKMSFEKARRCRDLFSDAHNFWEPQLHFLTYAMPDNSLDFIVFVTSIEPDGDKDVPAKTLFTLSTEPSRGSAQRIELSKLHGRASDESERLILNVADDWNDTGVIMRNVKLAEHTQYMAYYFRSYGAKGRFLTSGTANTRPQLENLQTCRT